MAKLKVDQHFPDVTLERFVEVYFSEAFNAEASVLSGLRSRVLVSEKKLDGGKVERRVRMVPAVTLPAPVQKLVGDHEISYDEVSVYDPARQHVDFHVESAAKERATYAGTVDFIAEKGGVRRVLNADIGIKVFAIGGVIERFIESETAKGYDKIGAFTREFLAR